MIPLTDIYFLCFVLEKPSQKAVRELFQKGEKEKVLFPPVMIPKIVKKACYTKLSYKIQFKGMADGPGLRGGKMKYKNDVQDVLTQLRFMKNRLAGISLEMDAEGRDPSSLQDALEALDDAIDNLADFVAED